MGRFREWALGLGLAAGLGAVAAGSRDSQAEKPPVPAPAASSESPQAKKELLPPLMADTETVSEQPTQEEIQDQEEKEAPSFETKKNAVVALLEDLSGKKVVHGEPPKEGFGYTVMRLSGDNQETQESMEVFSNGEKYGSIIIDAGGYTFKPAFGGKEIAVTTIKEFGSVLDEYQENLPALKDASNSALDFETQLAAKMQLEEKTTYFKSTN